MANFKIHGLPSTTDNYTASQEISCV